MASPPAGSRPGAAKASSGNLPAAISSFLGRREELSQLSLLLEGSRLVTLTGPPGIGKSRLGLELASGLEDEQPGGTWLVELAPVREGALVAAALAAALSVQEVPGESLTDTVVARLGGRRALVIFDNCEHLVSACADVVDALLRGCPQLRVLATSREPLSITGERVWQVPPLSMPPPEERPVPERLMGYDAVGLFVERAAAVQPAFFLHPDVAPAVAEISRRLDGIPLAIELAAARVSSLTPAEIARRLDDRFSLLVRASPNRVSRHDTLQAAVDWSHELLSARERALLRRLSVFLGGFSLEGAEAVCAAEEVERSEVLDLLSRLVSKSLVVADTANSRGRYRLLETIRAYAADRLEEAGEGPATGAAHARFYLALAEQAEPELIGPTQARWFERLEGERENLRSAIEWSLEEGQPEWALRLAGALALFWRVRCHFSEGRDLSEAAVAASNGDWPAAKAKALWGASLLRLMAGDPAGALPAVEECLSRSRELSDPRGSARALLILACCRQALSSADPAVLSLLEESAALARGTGDAWCLALSLAVAGFEHRSRSELPAARPLFEECLAVARASEDRQGLRAALLGLGSVAVAQGDYRSAESLLAEALQVIDELGEEYGRAIALKYLAELALGQGHYVRARELLEGARTAMPEAAPSDNTLDALLLVARVTHAEGDRRGARCLIEEALTRAGGRAPIALPHGMGELALAEGDLEEARHRFEKARDGARALGDKRYTAAALSGLGDITRADGDAGRAASLHAEALHLQREIGDKPGIATALEASAGLTTVAGRHEHAARLFGAAHALREQKGYARLPWEAAGYDADVERARQGLSAAGFETAFAQGMDLPIEDAVAQVCKGRGVRRRPANGWESLTDAERKVATLVAEGMSNRAIAEGLFLAPSTVKNHLSHIFSKLSIASRSELAAEVSRRGRPGGE